MRMNFLLASACLCYAATTLQAQTDTIVIGTKTDGSELKAIAYALPQRAQTFSISNDGSHLCISFRDVDKKQKYLKNKGKIGYYNLKDKKLLWEQPINYFTSKPVCLAEGVLIIENGKSIYLRGKENGTKHWKSSMYPIFIDEEMDLVLGYKQPASNKLRAVELKQGNELWKKEVPHAAGWNQVVDLDKTKRLIVADNLHKLDLLTGNLQTYPGKTGVYDVKAALLQGLIAVAGSAAGIAASGGAFAMAYVPTAANMITSLTSNVLITDSCYYWADREQVSRIDTALNAVWQTPFGDVKAAQSQLFLQNNKLFMLCYGKGLRDGQSLKKYGRPFIACFDPQSGREVFFNLLSMKKEVVQDAMLAGEALYMLFGDGLAYQALTDSVVNITPWNTEQYGELAGIVPGYFYLKNDNETAFSPLTSDEEYCLVYTRKNEVYEINKELSIQRTYNSKQIYAPEFAFKEHLCLRNGNDYWFIHEMGMPIAHLSIEGIRKSIVIENKLFILDSHNRFLVIDLEKALF